MSLEQYLKKVPKGAILVAEGDTVDGFYYLQKGVLERLVGGVPMAPDISEPQVIGEMGYFAGGKRTVTLVAKEDCELFHFKDINSLFHAVQKKPTLLEKLEGRFLSRANDSEALLKDMKNEVRKLERMTEQFWNEFEERKTRFFRIADLMHYVKGERPVRKQTPRTMHRPAKQDPSRISHAAFNQWMADWSIIVREIVKDVKEETAYLENFRKMVEGLCYALERLLKKYQYGWIKVMLMKMKDLNIVAEEHNLGVYISKSQETVFGTTAGEQ